VVLGNLSRAFGTEKTLIERKRIARSVFTNIARIPFDIGWSMKLSVNDFMQHCSLIGIDHVRKAHAKGKGVLILTLHMGNWEFLPTTFISKGLNVSLVYRPLDFKPADEFFYHYRRRFGGNPIPKKKSMRKILAALKRQECVGILLDQDSGLNAGVFADFFGHPACTNKGLALVAQKTGAPVIPVYIISRGERFEVVVGPEIVPITSDRKENDVASNTQTYNHVLESIIRQHPEQWLWLHKRWKTQQKIGD
jgi:KDO2-lipid IV(A) lauroyltransferase